MSGTVDKIKEVRKLASMDEQEIITYGILRMEEQLLSGFGDIKTRVDANQADNWPTREEVQEHLATLDESEQWQQFEEAVEALEMDVVRVGVRYHELALKGDDVGPFLDAFKDLLVTVHSPVIQESILLAVAEPFRPRVRDQFQQFGRILWGWYTVTLPQQIDNDAARTYLRYAGDRWGMDPRQLFAQFLGTEPPDGADEAEAADADD